MGGSGSPLGEKARGWVVGVHIRCCGNGGLWFRSYSGSLLERPKRKQKALAPTLGTSPRLGVPVIRHGSAGRLRSKSKTMRGGLTAGLIDEAGAVSCGSWLACDGITWVCLMYRGVCIAGKPAPTGERVRIIDQVASLCF